MKLFETGNRITWLLIGMEALFCIGLAIYFFGRDKAEPPKPVIEPDAVPKGLPVVQEQALPPVEIQPEPEAVIKTEKATDSKFVLYNKKNSVPRQKGPSSWGGPLPRKLKKPSIIVYKKRGVLELYDKGKLLKTYLASTGTNPGDKVRSGDRVTPLGEFYVCVRNPKSKFVLSLGLSYPSYSDARRGLKTGLITKAQYNHIVSELRRKRQPPWNTKLGGAIMIHGVRNGGRPTAGCIALENRDIRELYKRIPLRTKVTIKP